MGVTLRGWLASRLSEVGSLPHEKDRAGSLQSTVSPRCNPQGHLHAVRSCYLRVCKYNPETRFTSGFCKYNPETRFTSGFASTNPETLKDGRKKEHEIWMESSASFGDGNAGT